MSFALRLALAFVALCAPVVPAARRATWRDQWRADLWHYARWLASNGHGRAARRDAALIARATGCLPHAASLRLTEWSFRMLMHDFRFALRMLAARPAFTGIGVLILGLGIGANATIFSWVETVVLRPVPGVDVSPLVALHGRTTARDDLSFSYPNFVDLRAMKPDGLEDLIAFRGAAMNLRADGEPSRIWGQMVSPNFFDVLRVRPALGRGFVDADAAHADREPVAVLSHAAWQTYFGGDPGVLGRAIMLNERPFTVIGVAPEGFRGTMIGLSLDLFVPVTMQRALMSGDRLAQRGSSFLQVYGRLAPGASLERAQAGLDVAAAALAADHRVNEGRGIFVEPVTRDGAAGMLMPVMATLMAVVGVVLLIACANLAGLMLARAAGRQREVAVRLAVGASRSRIVRQFLVESLLLAAGGGLAGVLLANWTSGLLMTFMPPTPFPVSFDAALSPRVLLFSIAVTMTTAVTFGLMPALRASKPDVSSALKDASASTGGGVAKARMRNALVVAQVALSLLLLVCAALFVRGLAHASRMDPGFALREGVIASLDLLPNGYDAAKGSAFHEALLDRISTLPGVESATITSAIPLDITAGSETGLDIPGYQAAPNEELEAPYSRVGPRYFETMGIPIVAGRALDAADVDGRRLSVVVNETMARKYWGGAGAVGRTVDFGAGPATVVGIAKDGKYGRLNEPPRNYLYVSLAQVFRHDGLLVVRTAGDPSSIIASVQGEVRRLDPTLPLFDVRTVSEYMEFAVFVPKLASTILGVFGALALLLAVIGLYSVVAYNVALRTREIGVRVALGATRPAILRLVLGQGVKLTVIGLVIGTALAAAAAQAVQSQLMGVAPTDAMSFAVTTAVLLVVSVLACGLPALRATRIDPVTALRR